MTYDNELILVDVSTTQDEIGQEVHSETRTTVLCSTKGISQSEFYIAGEDGLRPDINFIMKAYEYSGQHRLIFEGENYNVTRVFQKDNEEVEIRAVKVVGY